MDVEQFRKWLEDDGKPKKTIQNRISNCKNVEYYEGDLDQHYLKDYGLSLLDRLSYSAADEIHNLPPKHNINIDGNIRNGSATLKQATKLYMTFKKDTEGVKAVRNGDDESSAVYKSSVVSPPKFKSTTIKILKVEQVPGAALKKHWQSPMQKIYVEHTEGFYIDTFEKIDWKLYENQEIEGFFIKESAGYYWLQVSAEGIKIINPLLKHTTLYSNGQNKYPAENSNEDNLQISLKANPFDTVKAVFIKIFMFFKKK